MKYEDIKHGVRFNKSGEAVAGVWAPEAERVMLFLPEKNTKLALEKADLGYWSITTTELAPGELYQFDIDNAVLPDPATLFQSQGVHGPSQAVNLSAFEWEDAEWKNIPLAGYIIYELHTGTFSGEGTFDAIEKQLDYLADLGITAIEIMPVAQFAGDRNWGYDGVFPFSVQDSYGGPERLQYLVNACHKKGLAVILDLVYNHIGPEGNVLSQYGPYFTEKYNTPWGNAINFDDAWCDGVRRYFIENALMWFRDFHIDALRLDAVHAIKDFSPKHILQEIKENVDVFAKEIGREHYLIVEMDLNDTKFIKPIKDGGFGMDGQWIDEFHHALRVSSGQSRTGYYSDFDPITSLAKSYQDAYVFDGIYSEHRKRIFGVSAAGFPGQQFVVFSQNHDHVGNRMLGERTSRLVSFEMQKLLAGAVMASPYLPMLFMGEEWSETNPFLYFVSHTDPELAEAVRKGRKKEFAAFHIEGEAPDPMAEETFNQSKLQWNLRIKEGHSQMLAYYKALIKIRKENPALYALERETVEVQADEAHGTIVIRRANGPQQIFAVLNFSGEKQEVTVGADGEGWEKLIVSSDEAWNGPGSAAYISASGKLTVQPESFTLYARG